MIETGIKVQGDAFDKRGFFVDEASSDVVTNLLISFYSSPITPVREIYTNALEVNDRSRGKITVDIKSYAIDADSTSNNLLNSKSTSGVITITDNGCGMSPDFIDNFFKGVGLSTKIDENGIGGYGLGAKSASYISNNAIWRTTQDGITSTLIVSRNDVSTESKTESEYTGEPNGTKVIMPVNGETIDYIIDNIETNLFDYQNPDDVDVFVNSHPITVGKLYNCTRENERYAHTKKKDDNYSRKSIHVISKGGIPYLLDVKESRKIINHLTSINYNGFAINTASSIIVNFPDMLRKYISPNRESLNISNKLNNEVVDIITNSFKEEVDCFISDLKNSKSAEEWGEHVDRYLASTNTLISFKYDYHSPMNDQLWIDHYRKSIKYTYENVFNTRTGISKLISKKKDGINFLQYDRKDRDKLDKNKRTQSQTFSLDTIVILGPRPIGKAFEEFFDNHNLNSFFNWNNIVVYNGDYIRVDAEKLLLPDYVDNDRIKNSFDLLTKFIGLNMINYSDTRKKAKEEGTRILKEKISNEKKKTVTRRASKKTVSPYLYYSNGKMHHATNAVKLIEGILSSGKNIHHANDFMIINRKYEIDDDVSTEIINYFTEEEKKYLDKNNVVFVVNNESSGSYMHNSLSKINRALRKKENTIQIYTSSSYKNIVSLKKEIAKRRALSIADKINKELIEKEHGYYCSYSDRVKVYNSFNPDYSLTTIANMKVGNKTIFDQLFPRDYSSHKKEYKELEKLFFSPIELPEENNNDAINNLNKVNVTTLKRYIKILEDIKIINSYENDVIKSMVNAVPRENDLIDRNVFDKIIKMTVTNIKAVRSM